MCHDSEREHGLSTPATARHVEGALEDVRADYRKMFCSRHDHQSKFESPCGVNDAKVQQDNSMATLHQRTNYSYRRGRGRIEATVDPKFLLLRATKVLFILALLMTLLTVRRARSGDLFLCLRRVSNGYGIRVHEGEGAGKSVTRCW